MCLATDLDRGSRKSHQKYTLSYWNSFEYRTQNLLPLNLKNSSSFRLIIMKIHIFSDQIVTDSFNNILTKNETTLKFWIQNLREVFFLSGCSSGALGIPQWDRYYRFALQTQGCVLTDIRSGHGKRQAADRYASLWWFHRRGREYPSFNHTQLGCRNPQIPS